MYLRGLCGPYSLNGKDLEIDPRVVSANDSSRAPAACRDVPERSLLSSQPNERPINWR